MPAAAAVARLDKPSSPGRQGTAAAGSPAPGATGAAQPLIIHAVPPTDESKKVTWMIHGPRRCREARQVVFNSVFELDTSRWIDDFSTNRCEGDDEPGTSR